MGAQPEASGPNSSSFEALRAAVGTPPSDCSIGLIVDTWTGDAFEKLCGKWSCRACGPRKVRRLARRFSRNAPKYNRFITLTLDGDGSATRQSLHRMSVGWRKLYYRLRRNYGLTDYAWVHEQGGKHGRLHKHLLVNSSYIPQRKLSRMAKEAGLGWIVDIQLIRRKLGMHSYLTKYLVKQAAGILWPRYARRVQHNLAPEPKRPTEKGRWIFQRKWIRVPRRRRPEPEFRLSEEVVLVPEPMCDLSLPFPRSP